MPVLPGLAAVALSFIRSASQPLCTWEGQDCKGAKNKQTNQKTKPVTFVGNVPKWNSSHENSRNFTGKQENINCITVQKNYKPFLQARWYNRNAQIYCLNSKFVIAVMKRIFNYIPAPCSEPTLEIFFSFCFIHLDSHTSPFTLYTQCPSCYKKLHCESITVTLKQKNCKWGRDETFSLSLLLIEARLS